MRNSGKEKFLAELLEEIQLINFPCDDERVWLVLNVIKFLISKQGEGYFRDFNVKAISKRSNVYIMGNSSNLVNLE